MIDGLLFYGWEEPRHMVLMIYATLLDDFRGFFAEATGCDNPSD